MTEPDSAPSTFEKHDAGTGKLKDFGYDLRPKSAKVTMQLAGSDSRQDDIAAVRSKEVSELQAFVARRTIEEERTDAPVAVRLFAESRMSPIVGWIPRGLEAPVFDAISRLEESGRFNRIPAEIVTTRHGLRVILLLGLTR